MVLWLVFAALTALATMAVLWPLARARRTDAVPSDAHDLAVYRDQLQELERDRERGLIVPAEAEAARTEIARRALRAAEAAAGSGDSGQSWSRPVAVAVAILVPLGGVAIYTALGSPDLPALPLEARLENASPDDVPAMVAKVERHLSEYPDDIEGWRVLAPIYARMGRFADSAVAWRRVAAGEGETPEVQENLGEMLVAANDGIVDEEAAAAFEAAIAADPARVKARFYRALSHAQAGRREEAVADYDEIIRLSPPDAPWLATVKADRAAILGEAAPSAAPGPDAAAVAAASGMSEEDRSAMIGGMVDGLAARLADDPNDADGWERLIRAYGVLGRTDDAKAAWHTASATFSSEPAVLAKIKAVADEAGVPTERELGK